MELMKGKKRISVALVVFLATAGSGLAQIEPAGTSGGPNSASDQQVQATDLVGKRGQKNVDLFTGSFTYSIPIA